MCGIIGYAGHRPAVPVLIEGLSRLEYRGYDSAGVGFIQDGHLHIIKAEGRLSSLKAKLEKHPCLLAVNGIGHTRWATHGIPAERNAHPHLGGDGKLALIHNGIIENYQELKAELLEKGYDFQSETDTEVLAHLIAEGRKQQPDMLHAFAWALRRARGAYAVAMVSPEDPGTVFAARLAAPLILGVGTGEHFVASDIPAFLPYTRYVVFLQDGEIVRINDCSWQVLSLSDLSIIDKKIQTINWDMQAAQKNGYKHFMLKEIFEQPHVIEECLSGRINLKTGTVSLPELQNLPIPERLRIVACGTSFHAGLWGQYLLEQIAHIPTVCDIASEFRYRNPVIGNNEMTLVISQSGETADTLAALRLVHAQKKTVLGLCNVIGSSITREADAVIYTQAGPEISVASTKAMTSQMLVMALLALYYAQRKGIIDLQALNQAAKLLKNLPGILQEALPDMEKTAEKLAVQFSKAKDFFYLGRGHAYPLALEGALKLKELSYIHAEGYASGEMKHGPIALIDSAFPTFALAFDDELFAKTKSNIEEVRARNGSVILLTDRDVNPEKGMHIWKIPSLYGPFTSFLALSAMQLFSYCMADYLGKDVDQPRNLAKSVTVE